MPAPDAPPGTPARHPSARALHEFHLALAPRQTADGIAAHVAGCERCRADLQALEGDHRRFEREIFPRTRASIAARGTPWLWAGRRWTWPALGVLAAAAAMSIFFVHTRSDDVRTKGGAAALAVFVARGDTVTPVEDGKSRLRAGDRIRFVLWPAGLRYGVIASIDGAGHATQYFPFQGDRSVPLAAQARLEIPGSIELDHAPGPERIFAVMSARPLATATVLEALHQLASQGIAVIRTTTTLPIQAASVTSILFEKTP
jgi:hypothetical protein